MKSVFRGVSKKRTVLNILFGIAFSLFNCTWSYTLSSVVGHTFENEMMYLVAFLAFYIIAWETTEFVGDMIVELTFETIENEISQYYVDKLYTLKPNVLKVNNTGYISGVVQKLATRQTNIYNELTVDLPLCLVYIIYYSTLIGRYNIVYGVVLIVIPVTATAIRLIINHYKIVGPAEELTHAEGNRNKLVIDLISNMNTVQKMNALSYMNKKMEVVKGKALKACKKWAFAEEVGFIIFKVVVFMYTPIVLGLMVFLDEINLMQDVHFQAVLMTISMQMVHNTRAVCRIVKEYARFEGTLVKLDFTKDKSNKRWSQLQEDFFNLDALGIDYTYTETVDGEDISHHIVIPRFHVSRGDIVCISGESGQGKTTLLDLISGQIENQSVYINGKNNVRLQCVFISQDTEIFDMSLYDNLTLGRSIRHDELLYMMESVGLGEWFGSLKDGFDTMLGERGVFVSTGQRQRINLIRGLLIKEKDVYLLDEPTSNVDAETEEKMIQLIKETLTDKTVVIVSHRMKISEICNKHYVFEDGILRKLGE